MITFNDVSRALNILNFVNFYKRFVYRFSHIVIFFIDLLKNNNKNKKFEFFEWSIEIEQTFRQFKQIFIFTFLFHHFDSSKKIRVETNVFIFDIIDILTQSNENEHWRSMTFWSRKLISAKQNYEIHNQKLLIIIIVFKQWKHYLKNNFHFIEM